MNKIYFYFFFYLGMFFKINKNYVFGQWGEMGNSDEGLIIFLINLFTFFCN